MVRKSHAMFTFLAVTLTGCATDRQAPFHVYQSPLLAADAQNPRAADRSFDPTQPGDWVQPTEQLVAESEDSAARAKREARREMNDVERKKAKRAKKTPTLAIGAGGDALQARGGSTTPDDYAPPLAAAYVHKTFSVNGVDLPSAAQTSIPKLWESCKKQGRAHTDRPLPGDAAFFHNAFDQNADGRNNDWYTHAAIVESVSDDGTANLLAWRGGRVVQMRVSSAKPDDVERNSQLRSPSPNDPPFTQYYAGELFAGYCTVLDHKRDVIVMDSWEPEVR